VTGVESFGLFIMGTELPAEGFVHISSLSDDYYKFDRAGHVIKGFRSGNSYRLGDSVQVAVASVDIDRRELDFRLLAKQGKPSREPSHKTNTKQKPAKKGKPRNETRGKKKGSKRKRR
jgi:ribonuclease R